MIDVNPDLLAFLKEEEVRSRNEDLLERAEVSLNSYNGELYGDEEDGRSKVVTRDTAEVIDQMQISVLRVFVSGDRVVEFEPLDEGQEEQADDATEAIHRQFQRHGYQLLHDWFKEGNLSTLGIVKSSVGTKKKRAEHIMPAMLMSGDEIEAEPVEGDDTGLELMRVVVMEEEPDFTDELVPLEEFRISPDSRYGYIPYQAHATPKTRSQLIEMDFDRDTVESLSVAPNHGNIETLSSARDDGLDYGRTRKGAMAKVLLLEEYALFDANDDGIAELLCIHRVDDVVLRIEECDYVPFSIYIPFPMPGRIGGHSLAEKVNDIQRINTVLNRLGLDGLYTNLAPGYLVHEDSATENTYDDLLTVRPNRIVRWKGSEKPMAENKNDVSAVAWAAMEQMLGQRESRTGITRLNQGLDADALNKTATGTALMQAQGQQMEEYLARNFAEAMARLMRLKLKLMSRYGKPMKMRVDGTFRDVDPSQWPEEMDVITRVGLGSGKKEQRLINRMNLLEIQKACMEGGLDIVGEEQIYKSIAGMVKDSSLGSPADFVLDPSSDAYEEAVAKKPPKQDPEMAKAQADAMIKQHKAESDAQIAQAKAESAHQAAMGKLELEHAKADAKARLEQDKAVAAAQLAQSEAEFEARQAMQQMAFEQRVEQIRLAHDQQMAQAKADSDAELKKYRDGGSLAK